MAVKNGVHLLKFPPHTTHLLQPLDVGAFAHMKNSWKDIVADFTQQKRKMITKSDFPNLLCHLRPSIQPDYAISGFHKTGIFPFSPQAVSSSAICPSEVFHDTEPQEQGEMEPQLQKDTEFQQQGEDRNMQGKSNCCQAIQDVSTMETITASHDNLVVVAILMTSMTFHLHHTYKASVSYKPL